MTFKTIFACGLAASLAVSCTGSDSDDLFDGTSSAATNSGSSGATTGASTTTGTSGTSSATGMSSTSSGASTGSGMGGAGGAFNPAEDPTAQINHPGDGEDRKVNQPIPFVGVATDPQDGALIGASLVWTSDKEGPLGTGTMFTKSPTMLGMQVITLTATDANGNVGKDTITLNIVP